MKKIMTLAGVSAALVLGGCASVTPDQMRKLDNTIREAKQGDFGECITASHKAVGDIEQAVVKYQTADRVKDYWFNNSVKYADQGQRYASSGLKYRQQAEDACNNFVANNPALNARLARLEAFVAKYEGFLDKLMARDVPGTTVHMKGVHFAFNSAVLNAASRAYLDGVAKDLLTERDPNLKIEVAGYTDSVGSVQYNLGLSQRRAESVRNYLVSKGIPASRITARGFGKANPVATNATEAGRALNRRVELHLNK